MLALIGKLNADPRVSGILILRPIPRQVSEAQVYRTLHPLKDIEALHPENAGLLALGQPRFTPSTPASAFYLLDRYVEETGRRPSSFYNGLELVLVGRSNQRGQACNVARTGAERDCLVVPPVHDSSRAPGGSHTAGGHPHGRRRGAEADQWQHGEGRRDRGRRGDQRDAGPRNRQDAACGRPRLRERRGQGRGDHAGPGRCRTSHGCLAPAEYDPGAGLQAP